jgi:alkylation response protein AidB-like acyl-CoA dehydrogenase
MPESIPPELLDLRARIGAFCRDELAPRVHDLQGAARIPADLAREVRERSRALGLFQLTQPAAFGGSGAGPLALTVASEALAAENSPLAHLVLGPGPGALAQAQGELRDRYLPRVMSGELRGAFAFTERSDVGHPTRATREGDELCITGTKSYVTGGARADFYCVMLQVDPTDGEPGGGAMVVVDRATDGVSFDQTFESLDGSDHVELRLERVRVPIGNVIGRIGEGIPKAMTNIGPMRLTVAAQATGLSMWTIDFVTQHLKAPHRSGTPLAEKEGVRLRLSDLCIGTYAARSMLYRTARLVEQGGDLRNEVAATKVFCTEHVGRVVDSAVQLVGGQALVEGHPLERLYRRVRVMRLVEGGSDVLRLHLARGWTELDAGRL